MIRCLLSVVLLASAVVALSGCASEKAMAAEGVANSVSGFQDQLREMPGRIDDAMATLRQLSAGDNPDRAATLKDYSHKLKRMSSDAKSLAAASDNAQANVQEYFRAWVKESRHIKSSAEREAAMAQVAASSEQRRIAQEYITMGSQYYHKMMDAMTSAESQLKADLNSYTSEQFSRTFAAASDAALAARARIERLDELIASSFAGK